MNQTREELRLRCLEHYYAEFGVDAYRSRSCLRTFFILFHAIVEGWCQKTLRNSLSLRGREIGIIFNRENDRKVIDV